MKIVSKLLIVVFLLIESGTIFSAESKLQLKLKPGQTIEFSYTQAHISNPIYPMVRSMNEKEEKWILEMTVLQQKNDQKYILELHPKRYIDNAYFSKNPNVHFDSMFPIQVKDAIQLENSLILYEILCNSKLKLGLDLNKNELIQLENETFKTDLEQRVESKNKTSEESSKLVKQALSKLAEIQKITSDYLLKFNNATFLKRDLLDLEKNDFTIINRTDKQIQVTKKETIQKKDGTEEHTYKTIINPVNGIVSESIYTANYTPFDSSERTKHQKFSDRTNFTLLHNSEQTCKHVTISGYWGNAEWQPIQLQVLNAPVGTDMESYNTKLDSTNHFIITVPLQHNGFIFIKNHHEYYPNRKYFSFKIYAEPGDTIHFELTREKPNQRIAFSGDKSDENLLLFEKLTIADYFTRYNGTATAFPVNLNLKKNEFFVTYADYFTQFNTNWITENDFTNGVSQKDKDYIAGEINMQKLALACNLIRLKDVYPDFDDDPKISQIFKKMETYINEFEFSRYYLKSACHC